MAPSLNPLPARRPGALLPTRPWLRGGALPPAASGRPALAVPAALAAPTPALRLQGVGIGAVSLSFAAAAGEVLHLCGGSPVARLRVLAMAAGFAAGGSGSCEIMGCETTTLDDAGRRALRERHVARVLLCDHLPAATPVLACVAAPLLRRGLSATDAAARATLELDALCAGNLAAHDSDALAPADARLVLLARAMAARPRLLVVEQPEAALATAQVAVARLALWSLASTFGTCVLMSSTHPRLIASADRCIDLDHGSATAAPGWPPGAGPAAARVPS